MPEASVCVIGLGRVGLPMAVALARNGHTVVGVEASTARAEAILAAQVAPDEPGLKELLRAVLESGALTLSATYPVAPVYLIATPSSDSAHTPHPSLALVLKLLLPVLRPGALILYESTCAPGLTRMGLVDPLERAGWEVGTQVFVAHSPERVLPGDSLPELVGNDRIIGGATRACGLRAAAFYSSFVIGDVRTCELETAELAKLVENAYRDVNIALANELASIGAHTGIDILPVIAHANTHPRVHVHRPGAGVGGHCLPLASQLLVQLGQELEGTSLLAAARGINARTPALLARRILASLPARPRVALCGVAYKADIADATSSPSGDLYRALEEGGARVRVHDPLLLSWPIAPLCALSVASQGADALVLAVAHKQFGSLDPESMAQQMRGRLVFDLCDAVEVTRWHAAGFHVIKRGQTWPNHPNPGTPKEDP